MSLLADLLKHIWACYFTPLTGKACLPFLVQHQRENKVKSKFFSDIGSSPKTFTKKKGKDKKKPEVSFSKDSVEKSFFKYLFAILEKKERIRILK